MTPPMKTKLRRSLILAFIALVAALGLAGRAEQALLPTTLAGASQQVLERNLGQAASLFATARLVDSAVSVAQTAEVSVGVGFQPGQALDPVNDLVERFSTMMLGATIVLGGAVLLVRAGDTLGLSLLLPVGLILMAAALWLPGALSLLCRRLGGFTLFAGLVLKIAVPLVVLGAATLSASLLDPAIADAQQRLDALSLLGAPLAGMEGGGDGILDRLRATAGIGEALARFVAGVGDLADILIDLCVAYVAKILLLPLLLFWILGRMAEMLASALAAPPLDGKG